MRQSVVITNDPSSIDQNQQLLVRFPYLCKDDVIVPGTARLALTITPDSVGVNITVVKNLDRVIVKTLTIKISGNEVMSIDDFDVFHSYFDLSKTAKERANDHYQGINTSSNRNTTSIRVDAGNGDSMLLPTRPSLMLSVIVSTSHWTSECSRATCHSIRSHWATGWRMISRSKTTAV